MARRSDEALLKEYAEKKRAVADRMARERDPLIAKLRAGAARLEDLASSGALPPDIAKSVGDTASVLLAVADGRVDEFVREREGG